LLQVAKVEEHRLTTHAISGFDDQGVPERRLLQLAHVCHQNAGRRGYAVLPQYRFGRVLVGNHFSLIALEAQRQGIRPDIMCRIAVGDSPPVAVRVEWVAAQTKVVTCLDQEIVAAFEHTHRSLLS
jgi:hypothetical protein